MAERVVPIGDPVGRWTFCGEVTVLYLSSTCNAGHHHLRRIQILLDDGPSRSHSAVHLNDGWHLAYDDGEQTPSFLDIANYEGVFSEEWFREKYSELTASLRDSSAAIMLGRAIADNWPNEMAAEDSDDEDDATRYVRHYFRFSDMDDYFRLMLELQSLVSAQSETPLDARAYLDLWLKAFAKYPPIQNKWYKENDLADEIPGFEQLIAQGQRSVENLLADMAEMSQSA